ncbi:hypothetical protein [Desulfovibrio psychrotolerans]|uniref:Uncharacterized protein n=1 Tax=Desulfovibrio psychrotolerans TaxID=415242 RepID=A0A7J0BVP1_9BACT|nr:hypothetical protein [Desulfovibrio psychrotolerans]GFM37225.1 hypothetical protein DSM19430T_19090 [Desulfovibrio psychrotolerans]
MKVFKEEQEIKRVIFNVDADLAVRLENAKKNARQNGKKLNVDEVVNEALARYLDAAEKQLSRMRRSTHYGTDPIVMGPSAHYTDGDAGGDAGESASTTAVQVRTPGNLAPATSGSRKGRPISE